MKKNIFIPTEYEEAADDFFAIFFGNASLMLSKFMKDTVTIASDKYKHKIEFGHKSEDNKAITELVIYGAKVASGEWLLHKKQKIKCSIYLNFDNSYTTVWSYQSMMPSEYSYWDYNVQKRQPENLTLAFNNEKPHQWKLAGYLDVPRVPIDIPDRLKEIVREQSIIALQDQDWPGVQPLIDFMMS